MERSTCICLLFFLSLLTLSQSSSECEARADIMLVLDGSGSIQSNDWKNVLKFATSLVNGFEIGPNNARFGAVQFSTTSLTRLEFGLSENKQQILNSISRIKKIGKNTDIAKGIVLGRDELNSHGRKGVPKIMILMTDGKQNQRGNPDQEGNRAKSDGIEIFTIGVTSSVDNYLLERISSPPIETHKFNVKSFDKLQDILQTLINETCIEIDCGKLSPKNGPASGGTVVQVYYEGTTPKIANCIFGSTVIPATIHPSYVTCKTPPGIAGSTISIQLSLDGVVINENCLFTYDTVYVDPCAKWDDNCTYCISHPFCGWCSNPVNNLDGTKGSQCAGFNKDGSTTETEWTCEGTYHTKECTKGWECNQDTAQCVEADAGNGQPTKDICEETCGLGNVYACNNKTNQCERCKEALPNCYAYPICSQFCYIAPPPDPNDKEEEGTPPEFIGIWRGFEIGDSFHRGEWNAKFNEKTVVIRDPDGKITEAIVSHTDTQLIFKITKGDNAGKTIRNIYLQSYVGVLKVVSLASGVPDGPAPRDFDSGMRSSDFGNIHVWARCQNVGLCSFRWDDVFNPISKRSTVEDYCKQFKDCDSCVSQTTCGWCSNNVKYKDGSEGLHCAGFNPDSSVQPFVCSGIFSTHSCTLPPAPQNYECDEANKKCIPTDPGKGTLWDYCNATCGKVLPPPSNFTPAVLIGEWRALEVENGYPRGEFGFIFSKSTVTLIDEQGNIIFAGDVANVEDQIWIHSQKGILKAKYQVTFGPETKYLALAIGEPGKDVPKDFATAISAKGQTEFFAISCLDEKEGICDFQS